MIKMAPYSNKTPFIKGLQLMVLLNTYFSDLVLHFHKVEGFTRDTLKKDGQWSIEAAEAEISGVVSMGKVPKTQHPTFPIMQLDGFH